MIMFEYLKPSEKKYRIISTMVDGKVRYIPQEREYMLCIIPYWSDIAIYNENIDIYNEKWFLTDGRFIEWAYFDSLEEAQNFLDKKIEYQHFHLYNKHNKQNEQNYGTKIHEYEYHGRDRRKE